MSPAIIAQQRCQTAANAEIDPHLRIVGVDPIHVVALFVGDHLERQFVVIAQEDRPLARFRNRRGLLENVDDREPVFHAQRHEQPRHQRKMKRHVALVAGAEIGDRILRPLVGLSEQHTIGIFRVDMASQLFQEGMGLRKIFAVRCLPARKDTARHPT